MKYLIFVPFFIFSMSWCDSVSGQAHDTKFEFAKAVYKVKGTVKKSGSDYVIIPEGGQDQRFVPEYLPEEYKKNGLEVTFDGDLGKADKSSTALNIHKIWVSYELKEKYKLVHKNYDLN